MVLYPLFRIWSPRRSPTHQALTPVSSRDISWLMRKRGAGKKAALRILCQWLLVDRLPCSAVCHVVFVCFCWLLGCIPANQAPLTVCDGPIFKASLWLLSTPHPHLYMSHHHRCGHAASRADGHEPWHARKPLGSSVQATGGKFLSANVRLTALAGQGADTSLIWVVWPFSPRYSFCRAVSLERSMKEWPQESLGRRGRVCGNGQKTHFFLIGGLWGPGLPVWQIVDSPGACFPLLSGEPLWRAGRPTTGWAAF